MFERIVLVGAGRTSGSVIDRLARIAPVTVIDVAPAALETASTRTVEVGAAELHPIVRRVADGTSRIVLSDLRGDPKSSVALVVAPGDDRSALECCRQGLEEKYAPVIAIVSDREAASKCEELGAHALVRAEIVGQLVEQSLQQAGLGVSAAVAFSRGELLEFRVLPSSPAIGVPLTNLRADGWRVAAIYRGDVLVLPTGATRIAADDRVLVVGDPRQLPHVAESLRVGLPTFPLLHGPNVLAYLPRGRDKAVETEAEALLERTRAALLVRAYPGAKDHRAVVESTLPDGTVVRKHREELGLESSSFRRATAMLHAKNPGVVVARIEERGLVQAALGYGGRDADLCNELGVPVLFAKGLSAYERVVLCITDGDREIVLGEVALDIARMFDVVLRIQHVRLPGYLQSADSETTRLVEDIERRARLHGLKPETEVVEGNPIVQWASSLRRTDLSIVGRRKGTRDSFSNPDLGLRLARRAKGSTLVLTVDA